jgi:hypothetical protein
MFCVLDKHMCEQRHVAARVFPSFHLARNATCSSGSAFTSFSASSRASRAAVASALAAVIMGGRPDDVPLGEKIHRLKSQKSNARGASTQSRRDESLSTNDVGRYH